MLACGVVSFLFFAVPARASSLADDFSGMTRWLSREMANGLAFNAGSTFDPPRAVKGWALQPDISLGIGRVPFNKKDFPILTVPALNEQGGADIFPNQVLFPNLALHLRMGLPWRGDAYFRFANATTPPGYKISPTMTAQVQSNSFGFGARWHFDLGNEALPKVALGAHYNHVRGRARLKDVFNLNLDNTFKADIDFKGEIDWNLNSFGLTAVAHENYRAWTPFLGFGYNYAAGSVRSKLELKPRTFTISDVLGESSDHPEKSQGRWLAGAQYARPTWSAFLSAEIKAIGRLQYRSWIVQIGVALPYEIGRGPKIFYKKKVKGSIQNPKSVPAAPQRVMKDEKPVLPAALHLLEPKKPVLPSPARLPESKKPERAQQGFIFLQ